MFTRRFKLFRLFGFQINADLSWFLVLALFTWSLATRVYPADFAAPGLDPASHWLLALVAALLFFASLLLHEMGHALMARRHQLPIRGITLFLFGGVAEMTEEPPDARTEFLVAIAGPLVSVGLVGLAAGWPQAANVTALGLGLANLGLVAFNMIPAFPLDGGRVLRSALWHWKGDLRWATRVSTSIGGGFGLLLIAWGVFLLVAGGDLFNAVWIALIGLFVRNAARMSYQQLLLRRALEGEPVSRFMEPSPVAVERSLRVRELVDEYVYRHHHKTYPVVDDGQLIGCVSTRAVRELPPEEWERQTVGALAEPCSEENTVSPDMDAMKALSLMSRTGTSRLLVADGDRLVGILALKDLLKFFSLKMELGDGG
jgi:Zn-dependent protease